MGERISMEYYDLFIRDNPLREKNYIYYLIKDSEWVFFDGRGEKLDKKTMEQFISAANHYLETMDFKAMAIKKAKVDFDSLDPYGKDAINKINSFYRTRRKKGEVYLIRREDGLIKIGCTTDLKARFRQLQKEHGLLAIIYLINTDNYFITEAAFHWYFRSKNKDGEWFKLTDEDIEWIKKGKYPEYINKTIQGEEFDSDLYFDEMIKPYIEG